MIMKNFVSNEISEDIYFANKLLQTLTNTIDFLEKENNAWKDTFDNLVSINYQDYDTSYGELSDTKYAHSA